MGSYEEGIMRLEIAARAGGTSPKFRQQVLANLGVALSHMGRHEDALVRLGASLALEPGQPAALFAIANSSAALGQYGKAEAYYRKLLRRAPFPAPAINNLGWVLLKQGNARAAIGLFEAALRIDPEHAAAQENLTLAKAALAGKSAGDAAALENTSYGEDTESARWLLEGNTRMAAGNLEGAVDAYKRALERNPGLVTAANNLGAAYKRLGKYRLAEEVLSSMAARHPDSAAIYYNLACVRSLLGDAKSASEQLSLAIDKGFSDKARVENDPDFHQIRNTPAFRRVLERLQTAAPPPAG
jgi:tetratricopeptide (TPR) repeat protein